MIDEKAIIDAVNKVKKQKDCPYFVNFGDFAILNKEAFDIFTFAKRDERVMDWYNSVKEKARKIKEILEEGGVDLKEIFEKELNLK